MRFSGIVSALAVAAVLTASSANAQEWLEPTEMSSDVYEKIVQGLIAKSGAVEEFPTEGTVDALAFSGSWENTPVLVSSDVSVSIRFTRTGEPSTAVVVTVIKDGENVVVRTDLPGSPDLKGGLKIRRVQDKARRVVLRGLRRSSLVLVLPPREGLPSTLLPVALCFREKPIAGGSREKRIDLYPEPFVPETVAYTVKASAKGEFFSGQSTGYGKAQIKVTSNLPPSKPDLDETRSQDPSVDIGYFPGLALHGKPVEFLPLSDGRSSGGISASVLLKRETGGELQVHSLSRIDVRSVMLRDAVNSHLWGETYIAGPGECTLVTFENVLSTDQKESTPAGAH